MSDTGRDGGAAFPCDSRESATFSGMTLRDYFAGQALAGFVSRVGWHGMTMEERDEAGLLALVAYEFADAMLTEREEGQK